MILASKDPGLSKLTSPEAIAILRRIHGKDWFCRAADSRLFRRAILAGERFLLPGIIAHYLARKIHLEREVETAIAGGCRRVIVLGAGYDSLAWRLHRRHPGIDFIEIDHPATQGVKRKHLKEAENFTLESADLNLDLPSSRLRNEGHSSAILMEGLTMYLPPSRVKVLLKDAVTLAGKDGKIIWTFMEKREDRAPGFAGESSFVPRWLQSCGEPFLGALARDEVDTFSFGCGMQTVNLSDHHSLRREVLAPNQLASIPLAQGELLCTSSILA